MYDKYRVNYNDTLQSIARKFNTNEDLIRDINNLYFTDYLREGMDIIVPKEKEKYFNTYKINEGDSLYKIAQKYNTNPTLLAALNGLDMDDYIYPNQEILLPTSDYSYYITKEGDTIATVSSLFRKNPEYLLKENETIYLMPGQILVNRKKWIWSMHHFYFVLKLLWWNSVILRKPYAFLIKHFKLIHLILVIFLCINLYYSLGIINFFNAYIANGYRPTSTYNLVSTYTPFMFLIAIIIVVALAIIFYVLLTYKEKPNKLYMFIFVYYTVLFILYWYISGVFEGLEYELIVSTLARAIRDISILYVIPQVPFIIVSLIRAIGFNLKKFAFESDFKDMNLDYEDSEEVEVGLNINSYKFKRKIRKNLREFKYYVVENKFVVSVIVVIVLIIIGYSMYSTIRPSYERYYRVGQSFLYNNYELTINDSLLTSTDYKGNVINNGKYYIVLKVNVKNNIESANTFDFNIIKISTDNGLISPKQSLVENFSDFGSTDVNGYIMAKESKDYVICYEIDSKDIKNNYKVVISNGIATFRGEIYNKSIYINLDPVVSNYQKVHNFEMNDTLTFDDEYLKDISLSIEQFNIVKRVRYTYNKCNGAKCQELVNIVSLGALNNRQNNYLINIIGKYESNNKSFDSIVKLINKNGVIEYNIDGVTKISKFIDVTPQTYLNGVILETDGDINNATSIKFIISTRNNKYVINIK